MNLFNVEMNLNKVLKIEIQFIHDNDSLIIQIF